MSTNTMTKPALPAHIGGERFNAKRTFTTKQELEDNLPDIVSEDEIDWTPPAKDSIYSKYDSLKLGQAIGPLLPQMARTISARLKRLGMKISMIKTANGNYAIKRLPDDVE